MISSDVIRGVIDIMILYVLLQEESYGYEISKQIRILSNDLYVIKETTLYSALKRLENDGYLISYSSNEESGKTRTYYQVTKLGCDLYHQKTKEWDITKKVVEQFLMKEATHGSN